MHIHRAILFSILQFVFLFPANAATVAGIAAGQFSVSESGAATFRIPIQVPPGVAGMQPKLELAYNSQSGNSLYGAGWNLSGLSAISRCPRTKAQDGARGGVNFDANDRYCMDGQRLILVSGTEGAAGAEYRTELDGFSRVIAYSSAGSGPAYFIAMTKTGLTIEFGNTTDSRIEAQGKTSVRFWGANKITDTQGNYLTFAYTEDNANGEAYVNRIDYTGNAGSSPTLSPFASVQFIYEARTDTTTGYAAGSLVKLTKRAINIKTYLGTTLVKDYRLTHEQGVTTYRSRLKTLTECDGANTCLSPQTFNWGTEANSYGNSVQTWASSTVNPIADWFATTMQKRVFATDVNGDGLPDILGISDGAISVQLNTGSNFGAVQAWGTNAFSPVVDWFTTSLRNRVFVTDVNGDGLPDILGITDGSISVQLNTGSNFGAVQAWGTNAFSPVVDWFTTSLRNRVFVTDVNGDGLPDILGITNGAISVQLNTGSTFGAVQAWGTNAFSPVIDWFTNTLQSRVFVTDVNGDGLPDILAITDGGISVQLNTGSTFGAMQAWGTNAFSPVIDWFTNTLQSRVYVTDVNGDGLPDIMAISTNYVGVQLNIGAGFGAVQQWSSSTFSPISDWFTTSLQSRVYVTDVNGDGLPDIMAVSTNYVGVQLNNGSGFGAVQQWAAGTFSPATDWFANTLQGRVYVTDFNGDGLPDIMAITTNYVGVQPVIGSAEVPRQFFITSISLGLGSTIAVTYKPLTAAAAYTKDSGANRASYPAQDVQAPINVVSSVSVSDGIGATAVTNYTYGGLKAELGTGRGMLGFRWVKGKMLATGIEGYTEYRQDFPYTGTPAKSETRLTGSGNAGVLKRTTVTPACKIPQTAAACTVAPGNRYFPYIASNVEESWELNGTAYPSATSTYVYGVDSVDGRLYGDPTQITVTNSGDASSKTTVNEYWPVNTGSGNWILGRLKKATVTSVKP